MSVIRTSIIQQQIRVGERDDEPKLWHVYPKRAFGGGVPLIGEKALCGHIKRRPSGARTLGQVPEDECVVCIELWKATQR